MPKEPKIKATSTVIDIIGLPRSVTWTQQENTITFSEPMDYVSGFGSFQELVKRIKSLRKENKRLNKERERLLFCKQHYERMILSNKPVAEFKCAKTNKPEKDEIAQYWCVYKACGSGRTYMGYRNYHGHEIGWGNPDVQILAFTETEPGEIVDVLNKEK